MSSNRHRCDRLIIGGEFSPPPGRRGHRLASLCPSLQAGVFPASRQRFPPTVHRPPAASCGWIAPFCLLEDARLLLTRGFIDGPIALRDAHSAPAEHHGSLS